MEGKINSCILFFDTQIIHFILFTNSFIEV